MIKIIDNKKVEMTEDEWTMYQKIVQSYTTTTNKGEDLFIDLFHSDEKGKILFLKPPSTRQTSFEVFLFLMSLQQHQSLRDMYSIIGDAASQVKAKEKELDEKLKEINQKLNELGK
jgi:hypothetical protein